MHPCRKIKLRDSERNLLKELSLQEELSFKEALQIVGQERQEFEKRLKALKREKLLRYSGGRLQSI